MGPVAAEGSGTVATCRDGRVSWPHGRNCKHRIAMSRSASIKGLFGRVAARCTFFLPLAALQL